MILCALTVSLALMTGPSRGTLGSTQPNDAAPAETSSAASIDPDLLAELEAIDRTTAGIRNVIADFEERKFTALLKKPLISRGTLRSAGSRTRWDTKTPHRTVMVVDASGVRIYYPERSTLEVYAFDEKLRWLAISPVPRLTALLDRFSITRSPTANLSDTQDPQAHLALRLEPQDESVARYLNRIDVLLDTRTGFVVRIEMFDVDDDRTMISFSKIRVDTGMDDSDTELAVPASTRIVRPLAGIEADPPERSPRTKP